MALQYSPVITITAGQTDSPVIEVREAFTVVSLTVLDDFNTASTVSFKVAVEDPSTGVETYYNYTTDEASPTKVGWISKAYAKGVYVINFNTYLNPTIPYGRVKITLSAAQAADTRIQFTYVPATGATLI
jgi:hypothetical protein